MSYHNIHDNNDSGTLLHALRLSVDTSHLCAAAAVPTVSLFALGQRAQDEPRARAHGGAA